MTTYAIIYLDGTNVTVGEPHTSRECAEASVSPFEGAMVVGVVDLLPKPVLGMRYALDRVKA